MGVVQGLTEFLPVSSSGHLALARHLLGAEPAGDVAYEVAVHAGTLLAVLVYYRRKLAQIAGQLAIGGGDGRRYLLYLLIATIPAGAVGLALEDRVNELFNNLRAVGWAWLGTAALLAAAESRARHRPSEVEADRMGIGRALAVGIAQALAILPGVSRSGATISTGLISGVSRRAAVEFSFILSLPVVGGAIALTALNWADGAAQLEGAHLAGAAGAAVSGYLAIAAMTRWVIGGKMWGFALYCGVLGMATLVMTG